MVCRGKGGLLMFVVTVTHKNAMWSQCYGPFDDYFAASRYWKEHYSDSHYRAAVYEVVSPVEQA